jgi:hypothetical protein
MQPSHEQVLNVTSFEVGWQDNIEPGKAVMHRDSAAVIRKKLQLLKKRFLCFILFRCCYIYPFLINSSFDSPALLNLQLPSPITFS